jgi:hypothetical protein
VKYVTIAGTFVKGVKATGEGTLLEKFAGVGYQQVNSHLVVFDPSVGPTPYALAGHSAARTWQ